MTEAQKKSAEDRATYLFKHARPLSNFQWYMEGYATAIADAQILVDKLQTVITAHKIHPIFDDSFIAECKIVLKQWSGQG